MMYQTGSLSFFAPADSFSKGTRFFHRQATAVADFLFQPSTCNRLK